MSIKSTQILQALSAANQAEVRRQMADAPRTAPTGPVPEAMTITLPLPPKPLSPNSRSHWANKAKAARHYRDVCAGRAIALLAGRRPLWTAATILAQFWHAQRRVRDDDNLIASLKAARDSLVDAGLLADDAGLTTLPIRCGIDRDNPRVEVVVTKGAAQ